VNDQRGRLGDWVLRFCGVLAAADGAAWLVLWLAGVAGRWSAEGAITMKTNMALGLTLGGVSLFLMSWRRTSSRRRFAAGVLGVAVLIIGGLTFGEHLFGLDLGLDQLLASELPEAAATASPNRMGPPGSLSLTIVGLGLLALSVRRRKTIPFLGLAVCVINLTPLIGYLYGIAEFYSGPSLTGIAWPTIVALIALGAGLIISARDTAPVSLLTGPNPAGALLRRVLPAVILIPLALGFVSLLAQYAGMVGAPGGTGLLVIGLIIAFSVVVWKSAGHLYRTESALRESEARYRNLFENMTEEVHFWKLVRDAAGRILTWRLVDANPPTLKTWGRRSIEDIRGQTTDEIFGPGSTEHYRPVVEKIMAEGAPFSFDDFFPNLDKHFRFTSVPLGEHFLTTGADITSIRKAQRQIEQAYGRLKAVFDVRIGGIGILVARADGSILQANDYYLDILGHTRQEFEAGKVTWTDRTPPEWTPADERALAQLRDRGACDPYEKEYVRRDGTRVPVLITDVMMPGPEKDILAIVVNMTERKQAEAALRQSADRFRSLAENLPSVLMRYDRQFRVIYLSPLAEAFTGVRVEQFLGKTNRDVGMPEELCALWEEAMAHVFSSGENRDVEFRLQTPQGPKAFFLRFAPEKSADGTIDHVLGISTDVTELKRAEDALRQSEKRLARAQEMAHLGSWEWDVAQNRVIWSDEVFRIFGLKPKEFEATYEAFFETVHPEDRAALDEAFSRSLRQGREAFEFEYRIIRRDNGETRFVHTKSENARDENGRIVRSIGMVHDITEQKRTEALRQALDEQERLRLGAAVEQASDSVVMFDLDGAIRYVNSAFEAMNRIPRDGAAGRSYFDFFAGHPSGPEIQSAVARGESWRGPVSRRVPDAGTIDLEVTISLAKDPSGTVIGGLATETDVTQKNALQRQIRQAQKMEALGTLAGGISHDFNNILGAITINTELALLDLDLSDPARAPLPIVLQAANRGRELVKQIITFSRQRAWERKPLEIAPVVKEGLGLLRSTLPKNVSVRERIDPRSGTVLADPSHIHQILVNLCQNAALAMMDRGGDLEVGLGPVEVDAFMAVRNPDLKPGPYVLLTVSDTGCGMESDILDRIFEPFFTTREQGKGSGLGLPVVHGIVKSYDGAITVQSQPGKGSVFGVYFHRLDGAAPAAAIEPQVQAVGGRERILLVEDEETQRTSLARGLEHLGYRVTAAAEGRSALAEFRRDPGSFDLVITDQTMPKMSGLEMASALAKIRPDLPVILCTGFSEKVDEGTVGRHGIREIVMKPFTITEITQAIGKALRKDGAAE